MIPSCHDEVLVVQTVARRDRATVVLSEMGLDPRLPSKEREIIKHSRPETEDYPYLIIATLGPEHVLLIEANSPDIFYNEVLMVEHLRNHYRSTK